MPTPPHSTTQQVHSTPLSKGSASHTAFETKHHQANYEPFLYDDIGDSTTIPFHKFLQTILKSPSDEELDKRIQNVNYKTGEFRTWHMAYQKHMTHETKRYAPFNRLVECVFKQLEIESINVCRNDPRIVVGSAAQRKPDCVVVLPTALTVPGRDSVDNLSGEGGKKEKEKPDIPAFNWSELLSFFEFKMECDVADGALSKGTRGAHESETSTNASSNSNIDSLAPSPVVQRSTSSQKRARAATVGSSLEARKRQKMNGSSSKTKDLCQCASYALEMMSHGNFRSHVVGALITDSELELLYYDHSSVIYSEAINFVNNPTDLVKILYCMGNMTVADWGIIFPTKLKPENMVQQPGARSHGAVTRSLTRKLKSTQIKPLISTQSSYEATLPDNTLDTPSTPTDPSNIASTSTSALAGTYTRQRSPFAYGNWGSPQGPTNTTLRLKNGKCLELGGVLYRQHGLIGRGTCVVSATNDGDEWGAKDLIVKLSFTPEGRTPEGDIVDKIRKLANEDDSFRWVLDSLPEVLHHEQIDVNSDVMDAFSHILPKPYERRNLQVLVMTRLFPITELTTTERLAPAIRDIFKCYRWLYEEAKLIHRDISLNNLMYRKMEDGTIRGVLSDFDLALFLESQGDSPTSKQRTGTQPFMAIDLLKGHPTLHLYRHDLESLFYVIVVLTSRFHEGQEIDNPPLQPWFELGMTELAEKKDSTLFIDRTIPSPTPAFTSMRKWVVGLHKLIGLGNYARGQAYFDSKSDFDTTTLGGHVSFHTFAQVLDICVEDVSS